MTVYVCIVTYCLCVQQLLSQRQAVSSKSAQQEQQNLEFFRILEYKNHPKAQLKDLDEHEPELA